MNASAAILVGGEARRLDGRAKPLLPIGGRTILERQLDTLRVAGFTEILLAGRWRHEYVPGVTHVPDLLEGGALAGIYSALLFATHPVVLVLGGDLPFVSPPYARRLATLDSGDEVLVPRTPGRRHPLCAGYRRAVAARIQRRLGRGAWRVTAALDDMRVRDLAATPDAIDLTNVNTPDDLRRAEQRASAGA